MSEKKPAQNKHMSTTTKVLIGVGAVAVVAVGVVLWASATVNNYEEPERTTQTLIDESNRGREDNAVRLIYSGANYYKAQYGFYPATLDDFLSEETLSGIMETLPDLKYRQNSATSFIITYTNMDGEKVVLESPEED